MIDLKLRSTSSSQTSRIHHDSNGKKEKKRKASFFFLLFFFLPSFLISLSSRRKGHAGPPFFECNPSNAPPPLAPGSSGSSPQGPTFPPPVYRRGRAYSPDDAPVHVFGKKGDELEEFSVLSGVACNARGDIFVADCSRIQVFDKDARFLYAFGSRGGGPGQLSSPGGLCFDHSRKEIVVCDSRHHNAHIFGERGNYLRSLATDRDSWVREKGDGKFDSPKHVTIDRQGNYVVSDSRNHRIQVFSPDGKFLLKFGSRGIRDGEFREPLGVGVLSDGSIVVADFCNHRVQVFDPAGRFIRGWPCYAGNSLVVDAEDNILVAGNRISVSIGRQGSVLFFSTRLQCRQQTSAWTLQGGLS